MGWDHGGKGCPVKFGATEETQPRKKAWPKAEQKGESPGSPHTHPLVFLRRLLLAELTQKLVSK